MPDQTLEKTASPVKQIISKYRPELGSIPVTAWEAYWENYADQHRFHDKTTIANIISCLMRRRADEICSGRNGLDYRSDYAGISRMNVVIVEREVLVRFKKLDDNLQPSNVDTEVQKKIDQGETTLFDDRLRGVVTVGYVPDEARTKCKGVHAVKHGRGGDSTWNLRIDSEEVVDHQIDDLFGGSQDGRASEKAQEPASLKLKPDVSRDESDES